jgi:hypothetical protein
MQVEFVNAYIERLVKEVGELHKTRLLLETQLLVTEKINADLLEKIAQHEQKLQDKISPEPVKKTAAKA